MEQRWLVISFADIHLTTGQDASANGIQNLRKVARAFKPRLERLNQWNIAPPYMSTTSKAFSGKLRRDVNRGELMETISPSDTSNKISGGPDSAYRFAG
jgi:hypothetical protein